MNARNLEIDGRTYYSFEEPDFVGPMQLERTEPAESLATVDKYDEGDIDKRFWRRQFGPVRTSKQLRYDWVFGVLMPAFCFFFDPIVFRGWDADDGILAAFKIFAYILSGVSIMGLAAWLLWGERLKWILAPLSGLFFAAGIVALGIAVFLLPFSLIGMVLVVGVLGFTPFFTSVIFLRNARRVFRAATAGGDEKTLGYIAMLCGGCAVVLPWLANLLTGPGGRGFFDRYW